MSLSKEAMGFVEESEMAWQRPPQGFHFAGVNSPASPPTKRHRRGQPLRSLRFAFSLIFFILLQEVDAPPDSERRNTPRKPSPTNPSLTACLPHGCLVLRRLHQV